MRGVIAGILIVLGIGLAASVLFPDLFSSNNGRAPTQSAAPAPPPLPPIRESLRVTEEPSYSSRMRVGSNGQIALTVQNDGVVTTKEVWLQLDEKLFDGLILLDTTPAFEKDQSNFGDRFLHYPGLAPGASQQYQLNLVGKTAGEFPLKITVSAPNSSSSDSHTYSGRIVVLP